MSSAQSRSPALIYFNHNNNTVGSQSEHGINTLQVALAHEPGNIWHILLNIDTHLRSNTR